MRLLFKDYLVVFVVVVALAALIFAISWVIPTIERATGEITDDFGDKVEELIEDPKKDTSAAGLYDANDNMVASWDELLHTYMWHPGENHNDPETYPTDPNSLYRVMADNPELASGVKLVYDASADTIGSYSCAGVTQLQHVVLPANVDLIEPYAFRDCTGLISVEMGYVRAIGGGMFYGCSSLTSVNLPENMTKIPGSMFEKCTSLESFVVGPNVQEIEQFAFRGCTSLTSIEFSGQVRTLGYGAFMRCTALESVVLGANLEEIGEGAFENSTALKTVTMPSSVASIGEYSFEGTSLTTVYYAGSESDWEAITVGEWDNYQLRAATIIYNHSEASYE